MISAYAQHGRAGEAISLFEEILQEGSLKPDSITLTAVLLACSHRGLVEKAKEIYYGMMPQLDILPDVQLQSYMVDVLGRAGRLGEAERFIREEMQHSSNDVTWKTLLAACMKWDDVDRAERIGSVLMKEYPDDASVHVLMAKVFARVGRWEDRDRIQQIMRESHVRKTPALSWIETMASPTNLWWRINLILASRRFMPVWMLSTRR